MFKKSKIVNIICISLAALTLALAFAVGFLGLSALKNDVQPDLLDAYVEKPKKQEIVIPPIIPNPYTVFSDKELPSVYLRVYTKGDYDGKNWLNAVPYTELIDGKYPATYLSSKCIEAFGEDNPTVLAVKSKNGLMGIPDYIATSLYGAAYVEDYTVPANDIDVCAAGTETYSVQFYNYDDVRLEKTVAPAAYAEYEAKYREHVYKNYLSVDDATKTYMLNLAESKGFNKDNPDVAKEIITYFSAEMQLSASYDTALDSSENVAIAFLETYKTGKANHFASAATLLFRSIGIPARYVTGFRSSITAGVATEVKSTDAHAWLEIYADGFGWKRVDVTPKHRTIENPYRVYSDSNIESLYLRMNASGDYSGKEWLAATPYETLIEEKYPATYLSSKQVEQMEGYFTNTISIISNNKIAAIPDYVATAIDGESYEEEYVIPSNDVDVGIADAKPYTVRYYDYVDTSLDFTAISSDYANYEIDYRAHVYDKYLTVDEESKAYMLALAEKNGFSADDPQLAEKIAKYLEDTATYNLNYDKALDSEDNIAIAFLETYKDGICQHFASVSTLMFRSLGIPARYVTGYYVEVFGGDWTDIMPKNAHAWTEIYVDGFGWKRVETTPADFAKNEITVNPRKVSKLYDGTPLKSDQKVEGLEYYEDLGYTYYAVISGERTEYGITESKIESLKIFDPDGVDVTRTFDITYETGEILVYAAVITLSSEDITKEYTGLSFESDLTTCSAFISEGSLIDGHIVDSSSYQKKELSMSVGVNPHEFSFVVRDSNGDDVSHFYKYYYDFGESIVTRRSITIRAGSATGTFIPGGENTTLVCKEYEFLDDNGNVISATEALASGDSIEVCDTVGVQEGPGRSENLINAETIKIVNQKGEDVTANYAISTEKGSLLVNIQVAN